MSGGFFDYEDVKLFEFADKLFKDAEPEEKQLSQILKDLGDVLHSYDWYRSGDSSKESFIKKYAEFIHKYQIKFVKRDNGD